jgi:hypothetical protein
MKTRLMILGMVLRRSVMMLDTTDGKKTARVGELMHWCTSWRDLKSIWTTRGNQLREIGSQKKKFKPSTRMNVDVVIPVTI